MLSSSTLATMVKSVTLALVAAMLAVADPEFEPARFESGAPPIDAVQLPYTGGGRVLLELTIDTSGRVAHMATLRSTAPFTEHLQSAVSQWRFAPARARDEETGRAIPVESRLLVAGVFRPPTTYDAPALGEAPEDVAPPSEAVAFPTSMASPLYPPFAGSHTGRVVVVEVEVGHEGEVTSTNVVRSAPGFDDVSLDAARQWTFRPARRNGRAVPSYVYIVFGFREPVSS